MARSLVAVEARRMVVAVARKWAAAEERRPVVIMPKQAVHIPLRVHAARRKPDTAVMRRWRELRLR